MRSWAGAACVAAAATLAHTRVVAGRDAQSVTTDVLDAVAQAWNTDVLAAQSLSPNAGAAPALSSDQGTVALPSVAWTGSSTDTDDGDDTHVRCTDCSISADLTLTYDVSVVDGAVEYLSVVVTATGQYTLQVEASIANFSAVESRTVRLDSLPTASVAAELGGLPVDVSVTTDVDLVSFTTAVQDDAPEFSGRIQAAITSRSGFVYTPAAGLQVLADETSSYSVEQVLSSKVSQGFAAHIALAFSHRVDISDFAFLAFKVEPALQAFSAPGPDVVSGDDFFYDQAFLCLFDGDCQYDEICVSSGECISYQREGGPTYCAVTGACIGGDPGCSELYPDCGGERSCSSDNCPIFHTHVDNLNKYGAKCCGIDERADTTAFCEFDVVTHVFLFEELPYYDFNDPGYDDFSPLLVALANAEHVVCGMGNAIDCVRLDSISPYEGSYYNGMVVTATVARNCGAMELHVMREYDCFDDCATFGDSVQVLFHGSSAKANGKESSRQLNEKWADRRVEAHRGRRLEGPLDDVAAACPQSDVINFAVRVGSSGALAIVPDAEKAATDSNSQLRTHVEPVDWGCMASHIAATTADELELLTMPVVAQPGTVWAGDLRYVGVAADLRNGDGVCASTYGFGAEQWADSSSSFATLSLQVRETTEPLSRTPTFHTRMLMDWGSLPLAHSEAAAVAPAFECAVQANADLAIDLRVGSALLTEPNPSVGNRSCWSPASVDSVAAPPTLTFSGSLAVARGNMLNLTDSHGCWQASLTSQGSNPLAQGSCNCDVGQWRRQCEAENATDNSCEPCPALPAGRHYISDGGAFWNGCTVEECADDCGIVFVSSGPFADTCAVEAQVEADIEAEMSPLMTAGVAVASVLGAAVFISLVVLSVYLVLRKKQDRLNDVHSALQLTSRSVKPANDDQDKEDATVSRGYESFQTDADIIID